MGNIIVITGLLAMISMMILRMRKNKKMGKASLGCGCGSCSGCPNSSGCHGK